MSQLPKLTSLPKPSGLPKPKFMPKVKTTSENVLPTKYIPSSQPSSSRVGFGTYKPVMKSNAVIGMYMFQFSEIIGKIYLFDLKNVFNS